MVKSLQLMSWMLSPVRIYSKVCLLFIAIYCICLGWHQWMKLLEPTLTVVRVLLIPKSTGSQNCFQIFLRRARMTRGMAWNQIQPSSLPPFIAVKPEYILQQPEMLPWAKRKILDDNIADNKIKSKLKTEKSVFVSLPQFIPTPTLELIRLSRPTKGFKKITKTGNDARNRTWDHGRKPRGLIK
eukprot:scaffold52547_cov57-Attheya_sp.AAC.2